MMKVLISLSLLAACAADMPSRRMQAATTSPPATTTPATTVTTTPGAQPQPATTPATTTPASFQSTATVGGGSRRLSADEPRRLLPAVSSDYMAKAYCSAVTPTGGYCTSTATLATEVWTLVATLTVAAGGAATAEAEIAAKTKGNVQSSIQSFLVSAQVLDSSEAAKFECKTLTPPKAVAPAPFVPPTPAPAFATPPFKLSFMFANTGGASFPNLTLAQETALQAATSEMFTAAGLPWAQYGGVDVDSNMGTLSQWGVNTSLMVPIADVNNVAATFVQAQASVAMLGEIITKKMAEILTGFNNSVTIENFDLYQSPTSANATLGTSLVNFSAIDVNSLRLYQPQQEGNFFDVDDDKDEQPLVSVAGWTMPTLGVVALLTSVAAIGFNMRRSAVKKSTRTFAALYPATRSDTSIEAETLIANELEAALE